jgi:hypothetical protein
VKISLGVQPIADPQDTFANAAKSPECTVTNAGVKGGSVPGMTVPVVATPKKVEVPPIVQPVKSPVSKPGLTKTPANMGLQQKMQIEIPSSFILDSPFKWR